MQELLSDKVGPHPVLQIPSPTLRQFVHVCMLRVQRRLQIGLHIAQLLTYFRGA